MAISSINGQVGKVFDKFAKTKIISKQLDKGIVNPAKFAGTMFLTSILSKDMVGCYYYTTQSLHNEKIPEENRKFVGFLDLFNGILMILGQFAAGKIVDDKVIPQLKSKVTGIRLDKNGKEMKEFTNKNALLHPENVKKLIKNFAERNKIVIDEKTIGRIAQRIEQTHTKPFETGISIFITALATTALIKRGAVPLASAPIAGWFKLNVIEKKGKKPESKPESESKPQPKPQSKPQPKPETEAESEEELDEAA